jgi:hypothetical protein
MGIDCLPATSRLSAAAAPKSSDTLIGSPSPLRPPFFPRILPPLPSPRSPPTRGGGPGAFRLGTSAPFRQLAIRESLTIAVLHFTRRGFAKFRIAALTVSSPASLLGLEIFAWSLNHRFPLLSNEICGVCVAQ